MRPKRQQEQARTDATSEAQTSWRDDLQPEFRAVADAVPAEQYRFASARVFARLKRRPRYAKM